MFKEDYQAANQEIIVDSQLKRRVLQAKERKRKPRTLPILRYGAVCASFLLVCAFFPLLHSLSGLGVEHDGLLGNAINPATGIEEGDTESLSLKQIQEQIDQESKPLKKPNNAATTSKPQAMPSGNLPTTSKQDADASAESVFINQIPAVLPQVERKRINLLSYNEVPMNDSQIKGYLGRSPIPAFLPAELVRETWDSDEPQTQSIYLDLDDGSVVYDNFTYEWNENKLSPEQKRLIVTVSKGKLPVVDCISHFTKDSTPSRINGREILIGTRQVGYGYEERGEIIGYNTEFAAEFQHSSIGFNIVSCNLSQEEFIQVLASVLK